MNYDYCVDMKKGNFYLVSDLHTSGILAQLGEQAQLSVFRQSILPHGSHLISVTSFVSPHK